MNTTDNKGAMTDEEILAIGRKHFKEGANTTPVTLKAYCDSVREVLAAQPAQAVIPALTPKMIEAAYEAHYGKGRVRTSGGAAGIDMTVGGVGYNGVEAFTRMWNGALDARSLEFDADDMQAQWHAGFEKGVADERAQRPQTMEDLSTLVRRLVREIRKATPDNKLCASALGYLDRQGFHANTLRGSISAPAVDAVHAATNKERKAIRWLDLLNNPSDYGDRIGPAVELLHKLTDVNLPTAAKGEAS